MDTQKRRIDWNLTLKKFATGVWGFGTYIALLLLAAWFAIATGEKNATHVHGPLISFTEVYLRNTSYFVISLGKSGINADASNSPAWL